ncbi:MAG: hypothetical protein JW982_01615 [Spirochaetes bacterium]|nr:hypothetical protein [Spirochaetota bacterium]
MKKIMLYALSAGVVFIVCTNGFAASANDTSGKTEFDIALTVGAWLPGTIDIEGYEVDKDMGFLGRGFVDAYLMPNFAAGAYINYFSGSLSDDGNSLDVWFYEFGIALKPKFIMNEKMAFKPGLNIGYRLNDRESMTTSPDEITESDGLGLNLSAEVIYSINDSYSLLVDFGFLSQPAGGNEDANVTWAPIFYLNVGVLF